MYSGGINFLGVSDVFGRAEADDGLAARLDPDVAAVLDRDALVLDADRAGVVHLLAEEPTPAVRADARIELHFVPSVCPALADPSARHHAIDSAEIAY